MNKVVHFLLTLLIMFAVSNAPAQALLKGGTWQELNSTTGAVNGTAPLADGATIPLYQGSMLLDPTKTYDIEFTAMPRDFSADASSTSMRAVNSTDTEGDLFTDPPSIAWENQEPPTMSLVWADAATPDTPLSPQPILNQTFCAQNLAGRQLVAWAQVEDENSVPALWLYTRTGVPNSAVIPLLSPKVTLNIKPAVSDPVSVSGDHIDANFAASKVKAGESITLTVSTKACNGDVAPNAAFVIRREDAINRQGVVNNANPVRVGDTELTTTQTEYHGVTDGQGNATVVVTQEQSPGVKTRLIVSSQSYPTLTDNVDVIFTTITSPDSDKANMYGHMLENATATLNGTTYTFTRPKLAAETSGNDGTVVDTNETWAQFTWSGADNHCDILPDAEQLVALRHEHSALATYTGWPVTGDAEYWSSTKDQINDYHAAVHMNSTSVVRAANSDTLLVSCVDKAQPAAHPQMTLSPEGPYKAQVGESIDLVMTVVDRDTQKPLPYRYMELYAELANQASAAQYTEDNEIWAGLYGPDSSKTDPAVNCAAGYFPSVEALDSLYSKYPNRTIKTAQGWPINRSYWSGSSSGSLTGGKPRSYYIVDLDDDSRRGVVNDGVNDRQYQICATTPKTQATQITLTSTLATDDTIQAVKAKNSESIPLLVTTTDAAGNPVPYTTFSLKRDAGTPRKADYPFTNSYTMTMTQSGGATQEFAYSSSVLYGATGANGTLALSLDEPGGVGVKSVVTASLYDTPTVTSSLPAVFTVITSPNSDKANMYGHMPETFTASNGAEFMRPLLYGELSSQNHTSSYFETNETWFTVNNFNTGNYGACPINQMATQDDLQSLYRDHPKGKITTDIGLPIKKKWWAGDSLVKNQSIYWQFTDLNTGNGGTTLETPGNFYYQLCLTEPRQMKIALSTDVWNADKSAAVAKTGEAIPMTVTVTNGTGQPQAGATVMLTRDYSYSRGTVDSKYIQAGVIGEPVVSKGALSDMTLTPVSPAGAAVVFNNQRGTSTKWYGVTGDDGKLRFTLNQDKSLGLRTSITATLSELAGETASVDAIFTVPTSPDTPYASYWGHMPDTVEVNGVTLRRPFLKTEMSKMPPGTWPLNNETWAANYIDYGETSIHATTSLPYLCGSLENAATLDDLKALKNIIGDLHWPTAAPASSYTYDYASQTMVGGKYCSFNETTSTENCTLSSQGFAYASCRVQ